MSVPDTRTAFTHAIRGDDLRRNLRFVTLAWCFGSVFFGTTMGAIFTVFAKQLGATTVVFGVLTAIPFLATVAQLPGSWLLERVRNQRRLTLASFMTQRVLWLAVALLPLTAAFVGAPLRITLLVALISLASVAGGLGTLGWVAWMSDLVPPRVQGRYFSRRRLAALWIAVPVAVATGLALDWAEHAGGNALTHASMAIFLVAAVCGVVDIKLLALVAWPQRGTERPRQGFGELMVKPLRNAAFRRYLLFYSVLVVSVGLQGQYLFLYLLDDVGMSKVLVNVMFMLVPAFGMLVGLTFSGKLVDRYGVKFSLTLSGAAILLLPVGWMLVRPGQTWPGFIVMFLGGLGWSALEQANLKYLLSLNGKGGQSGYTALFMAGAALGGAVGAAAATGIAWLMPTGAMTVGGITVSFFAVLFLTAAVARFAAFAFLLPRVQDAKVQSMRQSVRIILTEAYQFLHPLVFRPLRHRRGPIRPRRRIVAALRLRQRKRRHRAARRRVGAA